MQNVEYCKTEVNIGRYIPTVSLTAVGIYNKTKHSFRILYSALEIIGDGNASNTINKLSQSIIIFLFSISILIEGIFSFYDIEAVILQQ